MRRSHINIASLTEAALDVMRLMDDYANAPKREMALDLALYGYLEAKFGKMSRQQRVTLTGNLARSRIDYRRGTSSPVAIEFVVRPPKGGGHLYGSQNVTELRKLSRVPAMALRALLLMDLSPYTLPKDRLRATYDAIGSGPGNFLRRSVRVIYVQRESQYNFLWRP